MDDSIAHGIWIILVLLMVASSLMARRVPLARLMAWAMGWAVLFFGIYIIFSMIEPQIATWQQSRRGGDIVAIKASGANANPQPIQNAPSGIGVTIPMQQDGHYWVDAVVNGQNVHFLIDSGASVTALSQGTADRLDLMPDPMDRTVTMQTANGDVTARRSTISVMQIGTIQASDLPVVVSASFGQVNVLGMNFLNKLKSWRVEGGRMVLEPQ
jgi:aspartyl protease family protein